MRIKYNRRFQKNYRKRIQPYSNLNQQFKSRFKLFLKNSSHPLLKDHKLSGKLKEYRAFSVSGDIRLVYKRLNDSLLLYDIGAHNQVY
ncbi:type II toxin-antitoxin system mRNA interferase toxin, RelE/StbE family [Candidatus Microgenomates bacterium]|nr:type II toxin-antitoxin system mRNA interferase toxin, RelE/StbE family [Candidatus Microgenomates bacterium]